MKRTIFYSWQSDLPYKTNLNFIEKCLDKALKKIKKEYSINLIKDKTTRNIAGSIDITKSIFNKISNSSIFLADISIINPNTSSRKTPNPNVLLELGYAARVLGWSNIICLYNECYGKSDDLPFDLRNHRIMFYNHKKDSYEDIANGIVKAIIEIQEEGKLNNKILDFLKKEIDQEILHLISHFIRIIKNEENLNFFKNIEFLLDLNTEKIVHVLKNKEILGFYLFKSYEEYEKKFKSFIIQALSSKYYEKEILNSLIDIYEWFSVYDRMWTDYSNKFNPLNKKEEKLFIINGSKIDFRKNFNNRYLLLEKIDNEKGTVKNFGDFPPGYIDKLLFYYKFNPIFLQTYAETLYELIKRINFWLEITNNEIIIDLIKNFKIRKYEQNI